MTAIPAPLRRLVIDRAGNRCEYCHLSQTGQEATFHIDHIVPGSAAGKTASENLALACVSCSLRKGARGEALDPLTKTLHRLFNPRTDDWEAHFRWDGLQLVGLTPLARATVAALAINRPLARAIRGEEKSRGRHP